MSLDTEKIHRLASAEFDKLYGAKPAKWKEMVDTARDYAQKCVGSKGKALIGDVVSIVQNAVRIDPSFEAHLIRLRLTQKYWVLWYSEYIVDKAFPQPDLTPPPKGGKHAPT